MSILRKTMKVCFLKVVVENKTLPDTKYFEKKFSEKAFKDISKTTDEMSIGWTNLGIPIDIDFNTLLFDQKPYISVSMRIDQRKIKSSALKVIVDTKCKEWLDSNRGKRKVPKIIKSEIFEQEKNKMLKKVDPDSKNIDAVFELSAGKLYLFTTTDKDIERFIALFCSTFDDLQLRILTPLDMALEALKSRNQDLLSKLIKYSGINADSSFLDKIEAVPWFGKDFFKWLIYRTLESDSIYSIGDGHFVAYIDKKIKMTGLEDGDERNISVSGPQSLFSEIRTAFSNGKYVTDAQFTIIDELEREYFLFLKGESFYFNLLKVPLPLSDDEEIDDTELISDMLYKRMDQLKAAISFFFVLLHEFCLRRLSDEWETLDKRINKYFAQ